MQLTGMTIFGKMEKLLVFVVSLCFCMTVRAEYNATAVIYDGNGQRSNYWANTGGAQDEPLVEKPMLPEKNEVPYTTNAKYLEMKRVQERGREWHGIGFDLSGLNTTLSAGNQIAMWVKKDKTENVKLELQFTDGTSAVLSDLQWVAPEDGWKYLVFDFSGQSGDIQGKQLGNMFVQVHTGGNDRQTATISVTGIVKGFDLNDRPAPPSSTVPVISVEAAGAQEFAMTETQPGIFFWMGSMEAGELHITMSGERLVAGSPHRYNPQNKPDVIQLVSSGATGGAAVKFGEKTDVMVTLDCSIENETRLILNPYPETLYIIGDGISSMEDLIPFVDNGNGQFVVARYLPAGYNFKISTGQLSEWEPSFVSVSVNESCENAYQFSQSDLGRACKLAYRNSYDIEGEYADPVKDIWFETPDMSLSGGAEGVTYKISVDFSRAYPYILVEETSAMSVRVQDKRVIIENAIGEYKIQGLSDGEYHEGIIPVGGTVDELVNCNGIYLVEANGQSKRVLVY